MNIDAAVPPKRSGLAILWDTIVAPLTAFESLRLGPRWLVALIATLVVGSLGAALSVPANLHVATVMFPKMIAQNPSLAGSSPEKQQAALATLLGFYRLLPIFAPFIASISLLMSAVVIFVAALVARSKITFGLAFALACNVGFVYNGLYQLFIGLMVVLRGPEGYSNAIDLFSALPCLAWIAPGAPAKLVAFLALVNPFTIWSFVLTAVGLQRAAGMGTVSAYAVPSLFFLATALTVVASAQ